MAFSRHVGIYYKYKCVIVYASICYSVVIFTAYIRDKLSHSLNEKWGSKDSEDNNDDFANDSRSSYDWRL